jgi:HSP20 family protein
MNRLFDDLFAQDGDSGFYAQPGMATPAMDVRRADGKLEITAELPGVREDDIDLSIEDGVLILRGEKKTSRSDDESGYSERSYGTFERRIALPGDIDEEKCSADFSDGVLTITLPTSEEKARGRRIPLGRSSGQAAGKTIEHGRSASNDTQAREHQQAASEDRRGGDNQQS